MNKIMKTSVALVAAGMIGGVVASATTVSAASYKSELKTKGKLTVGLKVRTHLSHTVVIQVS